MKIYTYARDGFNGVPTLHSLEVKQTALGFKALERASLAFDCRRMFRVEEKWFSLSPEEALEFSINKLTRDIEQLRERISGDEADLLHLQSLKTNNQKTES